MNRRQESQEPAGQGGLSGLPNGSALQSNATTATVRRLVRGREAAEFLHGILAPVAGAIVEASQSRPDALVVVVHDPHKEARRFARKLFNIRHPGGPSAIVGAVSGPALARVFGTARDFRTARWCREPAGEDEIKVFLFQGMGTLLITLHFDPVAETVSLSLYDTDEDLAALPADA